MLGISLLVLNKCVQDVHLHFRSNSSLSYRIWHAGQKSWFDPCVCEADPTHHHINYDILFTLGLFLLFEITPMTVLHVLKLLPQRMWWVDCVCHKMSHQIGEVWNNGMTEQATVTSQMKQLQCVKIPDKEALLTSLKLSKAERMMSCPPLTRHTAASSSNTRALVLQQQHRRG